MIIMMMMIMIMMMMKMMTTAKFVLMIVGRLGMVGYSWCGWVDMGDFIGACDKITTDLS